MCFCSSQANIGKEEIQRRIEEAVATAVASPNDLAQEASVLPRKRTIHGIDDALQYHEE